MAGSTTMSHAHARTSNWLETLSRAGYAAKGCIYVVIGVLATRAAFGASGQTTGSKGAIYEIASQPFGRLMLRILSIGLFGYVIWRFIQAWKDPDNKGTDAKGIATRLGYAVSGVAYLGLAIMAGSIALQLGASGGGGGGSKQEWTAKLMSMPFGQFLVGLVGFIVLIVAGVNFYRAATAKFMNKVNAGELSQNVRKWVKRIGQFGLSARGVTFSIIAFFLMVAAYQADPNETKGLSGAMQTLAEQAYGPWLLGLVALGMVAYGIYCFVNARYRRLPT